MDRPMPGMRTPFVGRERELTALRALLDHARDGRGGVALVAGEPGIGKTRLLEELADAARSGGAAVLWGRCYEGEGAPAFWPWVQLVRAYARDREPVTLRAEMGTGAADIAQVIPEIRAPLPDLPFPPALPPEQARFRFFDSMAGFLRRAAAARPLVLLLDDLHWADTPSLLLLQFLADDVGESRLLVAGSYRDVEVGAEHPLTATLAALARSPAYERLTLAGLSEAETDALLRASGAGDLETLSRALHERTEGNPLFIQESVRDLAESARLGGRGAGEDSPEPALVGVPAGVREVLGRRLVRLSDACHRLLIVAAVIGREFDAGVVARAVAKDNAPGDAPAALDILAEAETARLIAPLRDAPGRYRFAHALIRETIYDSLTASQRVRLHRRVGEALAERYGANPGPHLAELAHHFFEAAPDGDVERAIDYAERAAERASALYAHEEAVRLQEMALHLIDRTALLDERRRCQLLLTLGEMQTSAGSIQEAIDTYQRVIETARRAGAPDLAARAVLGLLIEGLDWFGLDQHGRVGLLERTIEDLGQADEVLRAELLGQLAWTCAFIPRHRSRAPGIIAEAVAVARRAGSRPALGRTLVAAYLLGGRGREDFSLIDEASRIADEAGVPFYRLQSHNYKALHYIRHGDMAALDRELAVVSRLAAEVRSPYFTVFDMVARACRLMLAGSFDGAERLIAAMRTLARRIANTNVSVQIGEMRFCLDREMGRLAERVPGLDRGAAQWGTMVVRSMLAFAYADLGRLDEARGVFDPLAKDGFASVRADHFWEISLALLAEVCAALGDADAAAPLYRLLLPADGTVAGHGGSMVFGAVARHLGLLATTLRRWDDAERHFAGALATNGRIESPPWIAWTLHDHAATLLDRAAPGDRARADAMLDDALAIAGRLGMVRLRDGLERLRARIEAGAAPVARPDGLSAREAEVLALIAAGRTNKEIAEALVVSERTVERHAVNIYAKIGARGRPDAVAYALRHGFGDLGL